MAGIGDEFGLIARFFAPHAKSAPGALGLTDDGALVDVPEGASLVAVTDTIVGGVHFLAGDPPGDIARKAIRVNLSDLAAMGARPLGFLLGAVFPKSTSERWLEAFSDGIGQDVAAYDVPLIGGDTVAVDGPLMLTVTALGEVPKGAALTRAGAREGDAIFVSGTIGDASLGLAVLKGGFDFLEAENRDWLTGRYRLPQPRMELGRALAGRAHAAIDVSDGLLADLGHICECSGTGARIEAGQIPLSDAARAVLEGDPDALSGILTGGDDYELLFTVPEGMADEITRTAAETGVPVARIGTVTGGTGVEIADRSDLSNLAKQGGFRHFE